MRLLAVELAVSLKEQGGGTLTAVLAVVCLIASMYFVYRSFYGMTIGEKLSDVKAAQRLVVAQAA